MLYLLPVRWVMGALGAAIFHELCHLFLLRMVGENMQSLQIKPLGATIETVQLSRGREALCALAGPAGSLLLAALLKRNYPEMALCALVQGSFNLLPVYPLDGGRAVHCLASEATAKAIQMLVMVLLWGIGIWAAMHWNLGLPALFPTLAATRMAIPRKTPCKEPKLAVQ